MCLIDKIVDNSDNALLVLNRTSLNSDNALLVLNRTSLNSDNALLVLNRTSLNSDNALLVLSWWCRVYLTCQSTNIFTMENKLMKISTQISWCNCLHGRCTVHVCNDKSFKKVYIKYPCHNSPMFHLKTQRFIKTHLIPPCEKLPSPRQEFDDVCCEGASTSIKLKINFYHPILIPVGGGDSIKMQRQSVSGEHRAIQLWPPRMAGCHNSSVQSSRIIFLLLSLIANGKISPPGTCNRVWGEWQQVPNGSTKM